MEERYTRTKRRLNNCCHNRDRSDKEIIELLDIEIEQYRNRIECLERTIKALNNKNALCIHTNESIILVFTMEDAIIKDKAEQLKEELEEKTKCKCLLLCNGAKLTDILNDKEVGYEEDIDSDIQEIITTNCIAGGKLVEIVTEYKYSDIVQEGEA